MSTPEDETTPSKSSSHKAESPQDKLTAAREQMRLGALAELASQQLEQLNLLAEVEELQGRMDEMKAEASKLSSSGKARASEGPLPDGDDEDADPDPWARFREDISEVSAREKEQAWQLLVPNSARSPTKKSTKESKILAKPEMESEYLSSVAEAEEEGSDGEEARGRQR